MCNLPNMQDSDLKEITEAVRMNRKKTEFDSLTMFTVDCRLLKNAQDVKE